MDGSGGADEGASGEHRVPLSARAVGILPEARMLESGF